MSSSRSGESVDTGAPEDSAGGGSSEEQYRPVLLLSYNSEMFKSHWALFVPELQSRSAKKGKIIHVVGSVREGFTIEFRRNYDLTKTANRPRAPIEIGLVSTRYLIDTVGDGAYSSDNVARDAFEELLRSVLAPDKSLNSAAAPELVRTSSISQA